MADIVPAGTMLPATPSNSGNPFAVLTSPDGGPILARLSSFMAQPPVRRALPGFVGLAAIGAALLAWSAVSPDPQRILYAQLDDSERASVAAALDQAAITYRIDNSTGALTVAERDFYKARMLVASDGALALPESGAQMLDSLPMGASRTLEGERLRAAREADLQLTIREIDGVEGVRVHLAEGEKSVFVRDNAPPSASVMLRLGRGRSLSEGQVAAVVNLVAASVPGLSPDAVRVVDQHGRLLSQERGASSDRLDMQARLEAKLREQVVQLLAPVLGEGNFSTEAQVDLDMDEVTSASESYGKDGALRSETQQQTQSTGGSRAVGVPGVLSNTPPPPTQALPGAPQGTALPGDQSAPPTTGESSSSRTFELGREVSVSNSGPGRIRRVSVAVAISSAAMKDATPRRLADIEALVSAAVGADAKRGDVVKVVAQGFEPDAGDTLPFYETGWFALILRYGVALLAVLLVLLIGVRPALKAMRAGKQTGDTGDTHLALFDHGMAAPDAPHTASGDRAAPADLPHGELIDRQVRLARGLVAERPENAVEALRRMLTAPESDGEAKVA